ncbi:MAG: Gfo/Idh/MocA family oxidoreductase [Kiritimatiellae bacterium]|nr:Gfo/Idh/MocA family oxidoreductase [Kiritimatiellia bacterium]
MIRMGVVGYGYWGPNLVRNFTACADTTVVAVCDSRDAQLNKMSALYPSVKACKEYSCLLEDPSIDAIAIATAVDSHFALALQAIEAGKHIWVEKPFTATVDQGRKLLDEAAKRKLVVHVDHTFLYTAAVRKIRELVESGSLGELYYFDSVRVNLGLFQHDVNVLWDLAVHDLAIMEYILGCSPVEISATGASHVQGQPEDVANMTCFFERGLMAHFHVNWLAPVKIRQTLIGGSKKMIVYDDIVASEKVKVYDKGISVKTTDDIYKLLVQYRSGDVWIPALATTEALLAEAAHFADCVEHGAKPVSGGESGLNVVKILEAATKSLKLRGSPVKIG